VHVVATVLWKVHGYPYEKTAQCENIVRFSSSNVH